MGVLGQYLINGIVLGSMYGLVAVGLSLMFSVMRVVNMAHGELYMAGAYLTWFVATVHHANYWIAVLAAIAGGAVIGLVLERIVFRPTYGSDTGSLIASLGLVIVFQEAVFLLAGGRIKAVRPFSEGVQSLGSVSVTNQRLGVLGAAIVLLVALTVFLQRSKRGHALRASAQNPLAAGLVGINIHRMSALAVALGMTLATLAGGLLSPVFDLTPFMGARLTGVAFVIIVTGGMGSIGGAIIASFLIGLVESLFGAYVSIQWSFAVSFVLMILVLMIRPKGLFGRD